MKSLPLNINIGATLQIGGEVHTVKDISLSVYQNAIHVLVFTDKNYAFDPFQTVKEDPGKIQVIKFGR